MFWDLENLSCAGRLRARLVQYKEDKALGRPHWRFQYLKRAHKQEENRLFTQSDSDRTRNNGFKLKERRSRLDARTLLYSENVRHCNRLPREAVDTHPWRRSRPGLMGYWATGSSGWQPCPWHRGWNAMIFKVLSNLYNSVIPWLFMDFASFTT